MNKNFCTIFAVFCLVQTAYSAYLHVLGDSGEEDYDSDKVENELIVGIQPDEVIPRFALKKCQPGFCCPIHLECHSVFCVDPVSREKVHSILFCH